MQMRWLLLMFSLALPLQAHAGAADVYKRRLESMADFQTKEQFVRDMADYVGGVLHDEGRTHNDRKSLLRDGLQTMMDMEWIGKFVLGKHWNAATEEQRARYLALYREYITSIYVGKFTTKMERSISHVDVLGVREEGDQAFSADTKMLLSDGNAIRVDYRLREIGGMYKVIDIAIEGISLLTTHRNEFNELAGSEGIDGIITKLEHAVESQKLAMNEVK